MKLYMLAHRLIHAPGKKHSEPLLVTTFGQKPGQPSYMTVYVVYMHMYTISTTPFLKAEHPCVPCCIRLFVWDMVEWGLWLGGLPYLLSITVPVVCYAQSFISMYNCFSEYTMLLPVLCGR